MSYRLLLVLAACGCTGSPPSGTAVGNPGDADAKVSRLDPTLALQSADVPIAGLALLGCDGAERFVDQPLLLDGLSPSAERIAVPGGSFCELSLLLRAPILVTGQTPSGSGFSVALSVETLPYLGPVSIDGQHLLFELPLPVDAETIDALGDDVIIDSTDPLALDWSQTLAEGVALWEDADRDGLLSGGDRALVPVPLHSGLPPAAMASSEQGCGCAAGAARANALAILLAALFARSARRAALSPPRGRSGSRARCR